MKPYCWRGTTWVDLDAVVCIHRDDLRAYLTMHFVDRPLLLSLGGNSIQEDRELSAEFDVLLSEWKKARGATK